jgi:NADH:ubiquinone oxidoreductase subunit D
MENTSVQPFKSIIPIAIQTPPISLVKLLDENRKRREQENFLQGKKPLNEIVDLSGNIYNFVENSKGEIDVVISTNGANSARDQ